VYLIKEAYVTNT